MHFHTVAALAASIQVASAVRGFDTGNLFLDQTPKQQADFTKEFQNQKTLPGTNGAFTAARLYTMIQGGTSDSPISAIPAAIATHTQLLLGLWASAGQTNFDLELNALRSAIQQYGSEFADLVTGISVGSEDLYRVSPIGMKNEPGAVGAGPEELANYIGQVRSLIKGTALSAAPIGHVDTWTSYVNETNKPAIDACDWVGMNGFPYFQTQNDNPIENGGHLLYKAISDTQKGVGNKPVWVTETGWPTSGPKSGKAVASTENARSYWKQVYCTMPASTNLFWFEQTADNNGDSADFGLTGHTLSNTPEYDLSCDDVTSSSASASASHAATAAHAASSATSTAGSSSGSGSGSGSSSGSGSGSQESGEESGSATQSASSSASTGSGSTGSGSSGSGSSGSGSGSSGQGEGSGSGPAVYPTAATSGFATAAVATGSGGLPAPTSSLTPYQPNGASGARSTLALLAVPALLALML